MSRGQAVIFRSMTLGLMLGLAACSGGSRPGGNPSQWGRGDYTPPGPASDPWGPYIREAANRFTVPEQWVRAVMHQESGGHEYQNGHLTRSGSGAMGLMQLMPATWSELAAEFGLGNDPYEPHDNIMAGTGYIRQLYNKFGSPGFLAAYNAGPGRLEQYLETGGSLPDETVNYVASISPNLGDAVPAVTTTASPVMVASTRTVPAYTVAQNTVAQNTVVTGPVARTSDGCLRNVDAAYAPSNCLVDRDVPHADPVAPVAPLAPPQPAVEVASAPPVAASQQALPAELASYVEPASARAAPAYRLTPVAYTRPASSGGGWAVQVGAFSSGSDARVALAQAQAIIGRKGDASPVVTRVSPTAKSLYRARLVGFAAQDATTACRILHTHSVACFAVPQST